MIRIVLVAALAAVLLPAGHATAAEAVYAPYLACMANCQADESTCVDHIEPGSADEESLRAGCAGTKAACVQECQFLPIPPEAGGQPAEGGQQNQPGQGEEAVQQQEPAQQEEQVQQQEQVQGDPGMPQEPPQNQEPGQGEQPVQQDGAQQGDPGQQGGAAPAQQESETLNGIKIYKFE